MTARDTVSAIASSAKRSLLPAAIILFASMIAHAQQIQWQPANVGLQGGRVTSFAFDSISGDLYAGSQRDLFRFDRVSGRWVVQAQHLRSQRLATTGTGALIVTSDSVTYRIASPSAAPELVDTLGALTSIAVSGSGTLVGFLMPRYLVRSTDDGRSWGIIDTIVLDSYVGRSVVVGPDGTFFMYGGAKPLTRSVDDGLTWDTLPALATSRIHKITSFGSGRVVALGATNSGIDSLYRSTDNGITWRASPMSIRHPRTWMVGRDNVIHASAFAPGNTGSVNLYRSSDEGATWTDVGPVGIYATIGISPSGEIWIGKGGEIMRSNDAGSSWENRTEGFMALNVPQIQSDPSGRLFAIAGGANQEAHERLDAYESIGWGDLYRSVDGGESWTKLRPNTVKMFGSLDNGMLYVASGPSPGIAYSRDNGETWDSIGSRSSQFGGVGDNAGGTIVMSFYPRQEGEEQISEIAVSSDRGRTWSRMSVEGAWYSPTVTRAGRIFIRRSIDNAVDMLTSTDNGMTWAVSIPHIIVRDIKTNRNGDIYLVGDPLTNVDYVIYRSTDGGATWELRHEFLPTETKWGHLLLTRHGDIILSTTNLRSTDSGRTWVSSGPRELRERTMLSAPDGTLYAYTLAVAPWIDPHMPVRVWPDIYRSTDRGETWTRHDGPVPEHGTISIAFTPGGKMFAGTNGCGIYTDNGVPRVAAREPAHLGLAIETVQPNPMSGRTFARITLAARQEVTLTLSDPSGREISVLHRGVVEAGVTTIPIDASALSSGTYVLSLSGADALVSRRVVVQR